MTSIFNWSYELNSYTIDQVQVELHLYSLVYQVQVELHLYSLVYQI